eukprot:CAMPEP_0182855032 /NCGR_PEP_ID=MMETSP0034_2-20130328/1605_1 /TAXON_ID=156128 /ORGANISM="Nephroselmis pyriformis, Strain CCMP717" /LENGTH=86 /DNA_ID=CAMNT_0024985935 /DNA_START=126 /DNA_END=386 /DNA_ORIENTATION=+
MCYALHIVKWGGAAGVKLEWPAELEAVSGYAADEVSDLVEELWELHRRATSSSGHKATHFTAVKEKYTKPAFGNVASVAPPERLER